MQVAEQFVVLYDMEGWRLSHSLHLRKVYAHISTLQVHSAAAAHAHAHATRCSARGARRAGAGLPLPLAAAPEARPRAQGCYPLGQRDAGPRHERRRPALCRCRSEAAAAPRCPPQATACILLPAPQEHYPERLRAALLVGSALQPRLQP